jgi:hypothetical protein
MRNPARKLDHFETALHVTRGIGHDLAVFRRQKLGQLVHVNFQKTLELEQNSGASLRVHPGPVALRFPRRRYGKFKIIG